MEITKRHWVVAVVGLVIVIALAFSLSEQAKAPVSDDSSDTVSSTPDSLTEEAATSTDTVIKPFPINAVDTLVSWDFKGAYAGNDTLVTQARADIKHLTDLLGKGQYDDYDLYNGIANDYSLLGDGRAAYQNYTRAIQVHPSKGLVYVNLAHLLDQLGAKRTAADAYARAVTVEPGMLEYHIKRITFLTQQFPNDSPIIIAALTDASKQFGDNAPILGIEAQWLATQKRYADAIKVWETVKMLSPESRQAAIDTEIARLKTKQ